MMYYCEFPADKNLISTLKQRRIVGRYLIVNQEHLSSVFSYKAKTIVRVTDNGGMVWRKNRDRISLTPLTKEEQQELLLQILKSETW